MFLAQTCFLSGHMPPVRVEFHTDGSAAIVANAGGVNPHTFERVRDFRMLDLKLSYVDAQPGDCLIMSKRTLHMSDPRPHLAGTAVRRLAINMRVVLRSRVDNALPLNTNYHLNGEREAYKPLQEGVAKSNYIAPPACGHVHCHKVKVERHQLVMSED